MMEDKDMSRVELKEQDIENVVGGAFNWYNSPFDGLKHCSVDGVGDYIVLPTAKARFSALKLEHKLDGWTDADYAAQLLAEGEFHN